jgi:hypothetical protein
MKTAIKRPLGLWGELSRLENVNIFPFCQLFSKALIYRVLEKS